MELMLILTLALAKLVLVMGSGGLQTGPSVWQDSNISVRIESWNQECGKVSRRTEDATPLTCISRPNPIRY